jgi:hypothetical protein
MSKVIHMRPFLDPSTKHNWFKEFVDLWDNPYWFYIESDRIKNDKTWCVGSMAEGCPNPYSCNTTSKLAAAAGTTQTVQPITLTKFAFEYRGPSGLVVHNLLVGECPHCSNVHWSPDGVSTYDWTTQVLEGLAQTQNEARKSFNLAQTVSSS